MYDMYFAQPADLKFTELYMESLKDISPDSPAHIDWLYSLRAMAGLDTVAHLYNFPNTKERYKIKDIMEAIPSLDLDDATSRKYRSNGLYREYITVDNVPILTIIATVTRGECSISLIGCEKHLEHVRTTMEEIFTVPKSIKISKLTGFSDSGPVINTEEFIENDPNMYFANGEFYPFLNDGIPLDFDQLAKDYMESKASVMLLIGPPGTGKSTFIRTLIFKLQMKNNIVVLGDNTIMDPNFTNFIHNTSADTLINIEDADNLCLPRTSGSGNYQMSSLLNFADGIVSVGSKVIIATNLSTLNKVDPALIRDGRAFKVMEFKELTPDEANNARASIGLDPVEDYGRETITLASALNWTSIKTVNPVANKVGFV